jgi:hypothetical protein
MPQLIGLVIVIVLVLFALAFIAGMIYSGLLWAPTLLVMWVILWKIQAQRIASFADPNVRSSLAKVSFGNGKVVIAADGKALEHYMNLGMWRAGAIIAGMVLTIAVILLAGRGVAMPLVEMLPREEAFRATALIGAAVGPFIFILIGGVSMHPEADWIAVAQRGLQDLLKRGTAPLGTLQGIEETQKKTDLLMKRLTGTALPGALAQANQTMQENVALLFDQPEEMQRRLQALLDPARAHLQRLETFDRDAGEARQLHSQVVRLAMSMSHRSLMGLAEDALAMIEAAPRFIVSGHFDKAEQHLTVARRELKAALADPGVFSDDEAQAAPVGPSAQDCYARLRIDRSVTAQQLEDLWKRLRQTYHPDKGIADHRAYQAVREDIETVARDRGFSLRGVNEA